LEFASVKSDKFINQFTNTFWGKFSKDFSSFAKVLTSPDHPKIGLYTYPALRPDGSSMRIHLRIEKDGRGVMFIDVTEVIHLNKNSAFITKLALDGYSQSQITAIVKSNYSSQHYSEIEQDVEKNVKMVEHFLHHDGGCYTCDTEGVLEKAPLFSVDVNAPYKVDIAITYGCNNECAHCYNEPGRLTIPSLPKGEWFEIIDKLVELGVPHLILTGGEATLYPELPEIIKYADNKGMIVGLNSNGRYLASEKYMRTLADAGLNHVQITLGSHLPEVHNQTMGAKSFSQTVAGIESAISSGIHVITNTTLMRSNMDHAEEIISFLHDLGIKTFAMNGMIYSGGGFDHPTGISEKEMIPLLGRVRDHAKKLGMKFLWYTPTEYCRLSPIELEIGAKRCNAGEYSLCIEPNGDVLPCQSYYVSAGNILTDSWESIWQGGLFTSFRNREDDPIKAGLPEKCWTCPDLALCGGGCRIEREARDGVRIAESAGGGCSGCSGSCGSGEASHQVRIQNNTSGILGEQGYFPNATQTRTKNRSTGAGSLISLANIHKNNN
jgi:radical SAM protein with 4Fe4S-binding SPASM domain